MTFPLRQIKVFSILILGLLLLGIFFGFDKITLSIMAHHHEVLDIGMVYISKWAEWPLIAISIILSFYVLGKKAWIWALAFAIEGVLIQLAKIWINWPRPAIKFPEQVREISGITLSQWKAFPSGHTAAAFFGTALFVSLLKPQWPRAIKYSSIFLAFAVGYSRIYLGQHSFEDVLAGALIGLWLYTGFYQYFRYKKWINP